MSRLIRMVLVLAVYLAMVTTSFAQMFGQRQLGGTLRRRSSPTVQTPGLSLSGRRFVRGSRGRNSFVGADRTDASRFVGREATASPSALRTAITGAIPRPTTNANQPLPAAPPSNSPYYPRLELSSDLQLPQNVIRELEAQRSFELSRRLSLLLGTPIEASVEARKATLRGVVASSADRRRAELLASFEPGVSAVENELQVDPDLAADPTSPPPIPQRPETNGPNL